MNKDRLTKILRDQKAILSELITASKQKQKAVIKNDIMLLEETNRNEEIILNKLEHKESERLNIIISLANEMGLNIKEVNSKNIKDFFELLKVNLAPEEFATVSELRKDTKNLVQEADLITKQNNLLIEQANSFIKQVINVLFKSQNKPLLDRKA